MNLVDSSGWFEYFLNSPNARHFVPIIENTDELIVSSINYYEIYKRVFQEFGADEANRAVGFLNYGSLIEITTSISLQAAELSIKYQLSMADSLLLSTAYIKDSILWTLDSHFKGIPDVQYFVKE